MPHVQQDHQAHIERRPNAAPRIKPAPPRGKRILKRILISIVGIILILAVFGAARALDLSNKIFVGEKTSFYKKLGDLLNFTSSDTELIGEEQGQINILLLGIGGEGHDGPYLSDTMILAQIKTEEKKVSLVSIPRDYYVSIKGLGFRKINSAFAEGFARNEDFGEAGRWARETVEGISGLTIPYFAVIDFNGFKKAIDLIEGIDVKIDRTFTDYSFPDDQGGYIGPVTFKQGDEHMDGSRALMFARSRHAAGPEGSDFARGQRQQKIINATKEKALSLNLITDAGKINGLLSVLGDHFHTNLSLPELYHLYKMSGDFQRENIISHTLDMTTGLLCEGKTEDGASILNNCLGVTKTAIQKFFVDSFIQGEITGGQTGIVWLADTNKNEAIYKAAETKLSKAGFTVYKFTLGGPALNQTLVYPVNEVPDAVDFIKQHLKATQVSTPPPGVSLSKSKLDILVILGKDAAVNLAAPQQ